VEAVIPASAVRADAVLDNLATHKAVDVLLFNWRIRAAIGTAASGDDLDRWLDWALRYAERIDPVAARRRSLAE